MSHTPRLSLVDVPQAFSSLAEASVAEQQPLLQPLKVAQRDSGRMQRAAAVLNAGNDKVNDLLDLPKNENGRVARAHNAITRGAGENGRFIEFPNYSEVTKAKGAFGKVKAYFKAAGLTGLALGDRSSWAVSRFFQVIDSGLKKLFGTNGVMGNIGSVARLLLTVIPSAIARVVIAAAVFFGTLAASVAAPFVALALTIGVGAIALAGLLIVAAIAAVLAIAAGAIYVAVVAVGSPFAAPFLYRKIEEQNKKIDELTLHVKALKGGSSPASSTDGEDEVIPDFTGAHVVDVDHTGPAGHPAGSTSDVPQRREPRDEGKRSSVSATVAAGAGVGLPLATVAVV